MDERALFTTLWENESKTTRKVIARIPEGSTYRPDPKSRTASEIAWQIACEEKMIIEAARDRQGRVEAAIRPCDDQGDARHLRQAKRGHRPPVEGAARRALEWNPRFFRRSAAGGADGVEFSLRHRAPSRPDHDLPPPDGIDGAADLRTERGRALAEQLALECGSLPKLTTPLLWRSFLRPAQREAYRWNKES